MPPETAFQTQACCCLRDACIPSAWHWNMQLAGSPALANRPAEAAWCLQSRTCKHPGRAFTIQIGVCRIWRAFSAHKAGPYQYATNSSLTLDGRYWLAPCASLPPSLNFSRSNARGRSDLHSPKDGRPKRMTAPEYCKVGAG